MIFSVVSADMEVDDDDDDEDPDEEDDLNRVKGSQVRSYDTAPPSGYTAVATLYY